MSSFVVSLDSLKFNTFTKGFLLHNLVWEVKMFPTGISASLRCSFVFRKIKVKMLR